MLKRLVLENFMAHARTELEFGPGLTVLTGPNNIGKSAVVEALRCVATNPAPKHFIRHGAKQARVEVELENGARVAWIRKEHTAFYEVYAPGHPDADKPEIYAKFGRKPPREIQDLLRLAEVELEEGRDPVDLHLGNQRQPIFLLDQAGATIASFFAASTESAHLLAMQNLLKTKVQRKKVEKRELDFRRQDLTKALDGLHALPGLARELEQAATLLNAATTITRLLPKLEGQGRALRTLLQRRQALTHGREVLGRLLDPPALRPVLGLHNWLLTFGRKTEAARATAARTAVLATLAGPPKLWAPAQLVGLLLRSATLGRNCVLLRRRATVLEALRGPQALFSSATLGQKLERLQMLQRAIATHGQRVAVAAHLQAPPALHALAALQTLSAELLTLRLSRLDAARRATALDRLNPSACLHELGQLQTLRAALANLRSDRDRAAGQRAALHKLVPAPALFDPAGLAHTLDAVRATHAARARLTAALAEQERELVTQAAGIAARLSAIGACPLCGAILDPETFLHDAHTHAGERHADTAACS